MRTLGPGSFVCKTFGTEWLMEYITKYMASKSYSHEANNYCRDVVCDPSAQHILWEWKDWLTSESALLQSSTLRSTGKYLAMFLDSPTKHWPGSSETAPVHNSRIWEPEIPGVPRALLAQSAGDDVFAPEHNLARSFAAKKNGASLKHSEPSPEWDAAGAIDRKQYTNRNVHLKRRNETIIICCPHRRLNTGRQKLIPLQAYVKANPRLWSFQPRGSTGLVDSSPLIIDCWYHSNYTAI